MNSESHNTPGSCERREDYLFGLLGDAEMESFAFHLARCEDCATAVREERLMKNRVRSAVQDVSEMPPPRSLWLSSSASRSVVAAADGVPAGRGAGGGRPAAIAAALVMLLACVLVCLVFPRELPRPTGPQGVAAVALDAAEEHAVFVDTPRVRLNDESLGVPVESGDPDVVVMLVFNKVEFPAEPTERPRQDNPEMQEFH